MTNVVLYIFQCTMKYQPDVNPSGSKHATVKISKNKVVLTVFSYWLMTWKHTGCSDFKKFCITYWITGCMCVCVCVCVWSRVQRFWENFEKKKIFCPYPAGPKCYLWYNNMDLLLGMNKPGYWASYQNPYMSISLEPFKRIDEYLGLFILCRPITL